MERYFLLRDNRESGPYSLKELKEKRLLPADLIWVDEESTCWKNPTEIESLKAFVHEPEPKPALVRKMVFPPATMESGPSETTAQNATVLPFAGSATAPKPSTPETIDYNPFYEEERRMPWGQEARKKSWRRQWNIGANVIGLVTFVLGVMMTAVMIKKAVDNIEYEPEEIAGVQYTRQKMPASTTMHAAFVDELPAPLRDSAAATPKKDAVVVKKESKTELAGAETAPESLPDAGKELSTVNDEANALPAKNDEKQSVAEQEKRPENDELAAKAPLKATLQITANDYKTGLFGGVKNLELTVSNPSTQAVDKAIIEVEYIKPNGDVLNAKKVEISSLAAGETRTVAVPDNGRGVSVRYRVVNQ